MSNNSEEIETNCKRILYFLYETFQYSSVPGRQVLNSCTRRLLNHIRGENRLFVRLFDLIPTKEKQGRKAESRSSIKVLNKPENNIKSVYFDITRRQATTILLWWNLRNTVFICWILPCNICNFQIRFQSQCLIYNTFNPFLYIEKNSWSRCHEARHQ